MGADKDDEALEKYKRDLLGDVSSVAIVDEANKRSVKDRMNSLLVNLQFGRCYNVRRSEITGDHPNCTACYECSTSLIKVSQ